MSWFVAVTWKGYGKLVLLTVLAIMSLYLYIVARVGEQYRRIWFKAGSIGLTTRMANTGAES